MLPQYVSELIFFSVFHLSSLSKLNGVLFNMAVYIGPIYMWFFKVQLCLPSISRQLYFHSLVRENRVGKLFASMPIWSSSMASDSVLCAVASPFSLVSVLDTFIRGYCVFSSAVYPLSSKAEQ